MATPPPHESEMARYQKAYDDITKGRKKTLRELMRVAKTHGVNSLHLRLYWSYKQAHRQMRGRKIGEKTSYLSYVNGRNLPTSVHIPPTELAAAHVALVAAGQGSISRRRRVAALLHGQEREVQKCEDGLFEDDIELSDDEVGGDAYVQAVRELPEVDEVAREIVQEVAEKVRIFADRLKGIGVREGLRGVRGVGCASERCVRMAWFRTKAMRHVCEVDRWMRCVGDDE